MHHTIELSVPSATTDALLEELKSNDNVISLSVNRGAAIKPEGDVLTVHVLNKGSDEVLQLLRRASEQGSASAATAELRDIIAAAHATTLAHDVEEGVG